MGIRECIYCSKMFECDKRAGKPEQCVEFKLNPHKAEDYRSWVEEQVGKARLKR